MASTMAPRPPAGPEGITREEFYEVLRSCGALSAVPAPAPVVRAPQQLAVATPMTLVTPAPCRGQSSFPQTGSVIGSSMPMPAGAVPEGVARAQPSRTWTPQVAAPMGVTYSSLSQGTGYKATDVDTLFDALDKDGNGRLSRQEFEAFEHSQASMPRANVQSTSGKLLPKHMLQLRALQEKLRDVESQASCHQTEQPRLTTEQSRQSLLTSASKWSLTEADPIVDLTDVAQEFKKKYDWRPDIVHDIFDTLELDEVGQITRQQFIDSITKQNNEAVHVRQERSLKKTILEDLLVAFEMHGGCLTRSEYMASVAFTKHKMPWGRYMVSDDFREALTGIYQREKDRESEKIKSVRASVTNPYFIDVKNPYTTDYKRVPR